MALLKKLPLRSAWYGLIILASLLPALALAPWLSQQARELLLDRAMLGEELYHNEVGTRLFLETERLVSVLTNKSDPIAHFISTGNNLDVVENLVRKIGQREPIVNTTTIYDSDAKPIVSIRRDHHVPPEIDTGSPAFAIPIFNRPYISSPLRLSDGDYEFMIAVPLMGEHEPIGVMISTIDIDEYWQSIKSKVGEHDSRIYLVDGRGSLLTHLFDTKHKQGDLLSDKEIVRSLLAGKDWHKHEVYNGFENTEVFGIATLVRGLQWGVISEIPSDEIMNSIISALTALTLIVIMLHVMFGLISLMFTGRLLSPISDLAEAVSHISKGDYSHMVSPSSYREINQLTRSFNHMIHEIDHREASLRKMSRAIEQAGESIVIANRDGVIEYVNPAFTAITGYSMDEATGNNPRMLDSGLQSSEFYEEMWRTILDGRQWEGMLTDRKKDGSLYPVLMNIAPIFVDNQITHFVAIQQDMSAQKQMEEQLHHAQKMESLGTLVGGIAHDFNNILAGMTGNLFLIKRKTDKDSDMYKKIEKLEALSYSAARMISHLLAFARKSTVQLEVISLSPYLQEIFPLASVSIPENISLNYEFCDGDLTIQGDKTQLQQMLMNLLSNAHHAVKGTKHPNITLSLAPCRPDRSFFEQHPNLEEGEYACLTVSDNGEGIPENHLRQIFEPFFTTKEVGQGSGLGLSMVFGAMQTHNGAIDIESKLGEGTTFHLYFPLHQSNAAPVEPDTVSETMGDGEIILLVDDEAEVLDTGREVLESLDYEVITASDGEEGLSLFDSNRERIAMVITDVVMPKLGGMEMVEEIRNTAPDIPVIFTTGYDKKRILPDHTMPGSAVLTKPLNIPALSQQIKQLLNNET